MFYHWQKSLMIALLTKLLLCLFSSFQGTFYLGNPLPFLTDTENTEVKCINNDRQTNMLFCLQFAFCLMLLFHGLTKMGIMELHQP